MLQQPRPSSRQDTRSVAENNVEPVSEEIVRAPNRVQVAIIAIYPIILFAGSLASLTTGQSYFSNKKNVLNQLVVKKGWFWFSLVFWASYLLRSPNAKRSFPRVLARYAAATIWWVLFTQWLLGPPLMDRIFLWTGGACDIVQTATSSQICRRSGGTWVGGHDPSGHVFLLVQSSLVLWMEILPSIWFWWKYGNSQGESNTNVIGLGVKIPLVLLFIWAWMLLMTGIYFHSFLEKLSGLLFGMVEVALVYALGEHKSWGRYFGVNTIN